MVMLLIVLRCATEESTAVEVEERSISEGGGTVYRWYMVSEMFILAFVLCLCFICCGGVMVLLIFKWR